MNGPEARKKIKSHWMFYVGRFIFSVLFRTIWRLQIYGHENIPDSGGVIIAPNHVSLADPPLIGAAVKRPVFFVAKEELYGLPVIGYFIQRTNTISVKRGVQDIGAFRSALGLLEDGKVLAIFPEGTRSKDGNFGKAKAGAGMLACLSGVPVVPARIYNSDRLFSFARLKVIFGKPVYPPKESVKETYMQFSKEILEEIKKL